MQETPITKLINGLGRRRLADATGASLATVHKWAANGRIPANWQASVVEFAREQNGFRHIDGNWMIEQHAETARRAS